MENSSSQNKSNTHSNNSNITISLANPELSPNIKTEIAQKISQLENIINTSLWNTSSINQRQLFNIESLLKECEKAVITMEVELSSFSKKTKDKYNLPNFKSKILSLKNGFRDWEMHYKSNHEDNEEDEVRERWVSATADIEDGNKKMAESIRIMSNVNQTDKDTMRSLSNQTNIIVNTGNILGDADSYIRKSGKVWNSMINRAMTNKLILIGIVIMLGWINAFLIYYKVKNKFN